MLQRRAKKAGVTTAICNHSWRATGITTFLENGGAIEMAQYEHPGCIKPGRNL